MDLWRVYETSLVSKARNKGAEKAFVSGLYTFHGKTRPANASNNIGGRLEPRNKSVFQASLRKLVQLLKSQSPNASALAEADVAMRRHAVEYYYGEEFKKLLNKARAIAKVLELRREAEASAKAAQEAKGRALRNAKAAAMTFVKSLKEAERKAAALGAKNITPEAATTAVNEARKLLPGSHVPEADAIVAELKAWANLKYPGARNRLRRPLGPRSRPFAQGWEAHVKGKLNNDLRYSNFAPALARLQTGYRSNTNFLVELNKVLKNHFKPQALFAQNYKNFMNDPKFRNILQRTTETKKRFYKRRFLGMSAPLTPQEAQVWITRTRSSFGPRAYYGNMTNKWKNMDPNKYENLTPLQKNALKRVIRSVRVNALEPNKRTVRWEGNRYELNNNLMAIKNNQELLKAIKAQVAKRRANSNARMANTGPVPNTGGQAASTTAAKSEPFRPSMYNMMGLN